MQYQRAARLLRRFGKNCGFGVTPLVAFAYGFCVVENSFLITREGATVCFTRSESASGQVLDAGQLSVRSLLVAGVQKPCMGPIGVKERVAALLSHFVTSQDCICGMDSPLLGCAERSSPKAACGAPKARGLTANASAETS